ncbi:flagellar protein export ATPase FliI [Simkania negevensis]|uniref:Flagellar protein export ATPase FliI n=1 Tax=Simkania negevensis TaxID=83561 RepID=A0ABS3ATC1_9BACT|nr:flagellar protein export ATPase FliI [Simkania negevensis]
MQWSLRREQEHIEEWRGVRLSGKVTHIIGLLIESMGPAVAVGEVCGIHSSDGSYILAEVVGFKDQKVLLMPIGEMGRIAPGAEVRPTGAIHQVKVSECLAGRILDALGNPIDGKGPVHVQAYYPVSAPPPNALTRMRVTEKLVTGIKSLDATCTAGKGQRFGIFSGSGVGKSTLIGMIAKMSSADINVIALIGERGREVREFLEKDLGPEGLERSVVVVATSDQAALLRTKGASVATAIAEYFRDLGKNVVLMMDSITRYAMALREIGLAIGEPPTTKGYTPSVFAQLPKLLERAGNSDRGSITGIYSILTEGDDLHDPIAETVRSILDGHIVLSRKLATSNHYPAVSVLESLSRVMPDIVSEEEMYRAGKLRDLLQVYKEAEDLINIGAYQSGSSQSIDCAIAFIDKIQEFLKQKSSERFLYEETQEQLKGIIDAAMK